MGVILTTYDTWDDPPSTHSSLSAQPSPVSSLRKPLAIRQFGVNSLQELLNMIKDTMEILSSFLGFFVFDFFVFQSFISPHFAMFVF